MPNPNRNKGHRWELTVLAMLKPIFPNILTSRNESRTEDAKKIDLVNTGDLAVQCKNYKSKPNFTKIFKEMQTEKTKVIFYKNNKIRGKKGEFVICEIDNNLVTFSAEMYLKLLSENLGRAECAEEYIHNKIGVVMFKMEN